MKRLEKAEKNATKKDEALQKLRDLMLQAKKSEAAAKEKLDEVETEVSQALDEHKSLVEELKGLEQRELSATNRCETLRSERHEVLKRCTMGAIEVPMKASKDDESEADEHDSVRRAMWRWPRLGALSTHYPLADVCEGQRRNIESGE